MPLPDCIGLTLAEAKKMLKAGGWQLKRYFFSGLWPPDKNEEKEGRVVRLRLLTGTNQVELVLTYIDPLKFFKEGGAKTNAP